MVTRRDVEAITAAQLAALYDRLEAYERAQAPVWRVDIPAPARWLNANHRAGKHLHVAEQVAAWRHAAATFARRARVPRLQRVRIVMALRFPDRRRRDPHNWSPTAKAITDGLVDAGLVVDDDYRHVTGPDLRIGEPAPRTCRLGMVTVIVFDRPEDGV